MLTPQRRSEIIDALRRGTVPRRGLESFAVGLERFDSSIEEELDRVAAGFSQFKAVRGDYGCGKTFFSRLLCDKARKKGFASSEVQISETETPLHRLETVYRRLVEHLAMNDSTEGTLRNIIDGWFYILEEDALTEGDIVETNQEALFQRTNELMESRLKKITAVSPAFAAALRGYRRALVEGETGFADAILAWLGGQPNVSSPAKRYAGVKGEIDHFGAMAFLQGLLTMLRDSGHSGLILVMDEVETLQRVRSDVRDKGLNALRQFIDEIDAGRFPGFYLVVTGTPAFFDGPNGIRRLEPLSQRIHTDFATESRFDNPRAVQIRLPGFDLERLVMVGERIREIYRNGAESPGRIEKVCDNKFIRDLANSVAGNFGGKIGIAPRIFLRKLTADVLDRIDQFPDFHPRQHYSLTVEESELNDLERNVRAAANVDEIDLEL